MKLLLLILSFSVVNQAFAGGGGIGNGGGLIVCKNPDQSIKSIELLDYFEARELRGLQIVTQNYPGDFKAKTQALLNRIGQYSELRQRVYSQWLSDFDQESQVLNGLQFNNIPDALEIGIPDGCEFAQGAVQKIPSLPGDKRFYINGDVWRFMNDDQKAGLILHELAYREALSYGHTDSVNTRYFVGLLSSSAFDSLGFNNFIKTLNTIHYEITDFPALDTKLVSHYTPTSLWRMDPDFDGPAPSALSFTGRIVANVGECLDVGCSNWKSLLSATTNHNFQICGPEQFTDGSGNRFEILLQNGADRILGVGCSTKTTLEWGPANDQGFFSTSVSSEVLDAQANKIAVKNGPILFTPSGGKAPLDLIHLETMNGTMSYFATGSGIQWSNFYLNPLPTTPNQTCEVDFILDHSDPAKVSYMGVDSTNTCSETVNFETFQLLLGPSNSSTRSIRFDSNGNYESGGSLSSILSKGAVRVKLDCGNSPCQIDQVINGIPTQITVKEGANIGRINPSFYENTCLIKPGLVELYSTSVPKMIVTNADCALYDKNNLKHLVKMGTPVNFDSDGEISNGAQFE